ncbi:hypothetical protein RBB50_010197 [Rhinocladiella similis]
MPGKYSHTVVLATYSSRGILNFPSGQRSNADREDFSGTSLSSSYPKPRNGGSTAAKQTSVAAPSQSTPRRLRRQQNRVPSRKSTEPSNLALNPARRDSYDHRSGGAAQTPGISSHSQESQPRQSDAGLKSWSKPKTGLAGNKPDENDPWVIPWRESRQTRTDVAEHAVSHASNTHERPQHPHSHKHEPRPDVREWRQNMPRRTRDRPRKAERHTEPLLSLQQFLDLLPPPDGPGSQLDRKSLQPPRSSSSKQVSLLPAFQPPPSRCDSAPSLQGRSPRLESARPSPRTANSNDSFNRGDTSFIDSSDDEGEEEPEHEKLHARHMPSSTSAQHDDARPLFPSHQENASSGRKIIDLTKALPELPAISSPRLENDLNSPSATIEQVQKKQSKRYSLYGYESDASEDFPLQRHSPLPRLRSATIRAADLAELTPPIFEMPDNEVERKSDSSQTGASPSDLELQRTDVAAGDRQSAISKSSDKDDFEEYLNNPSIIGQPHVHQRYYRATGDETIKSESRSSISRLMSRTSFDRGRGSSPSQLTDVRGRAPTRADDDPPQPRRDASTSSTPDMPERTPQEIRSKTPQLVQHDSRGVASPAQSPGSTISSKPVNPTPNFGTLSVVRDPEEKAMLNVQNVSRSTTPLPEEAKRSPQKFLQLQRHLLRSSSDLTSIKSISVPASTRRGSYTSSLESPDKKRKSPEVGTPSSPDFGDDGWGRVSIEPARSTRHAALLEPRPTRSHGIVEKRGRYSDENDQDDRAALPPPSISRRRPGENEHGVGAAGARSQSRGVLGRLMNW